MIGEQLLYLDGAWVPGSSSKTIVDRWTGETIGSVALGTSEHATLAVDAAEKAMRNPLSVPHRSRILAAVAADVSARSEEFARAITAETGKPITAARGEVSRAVETLTWSAEETKRLPGETVALDAIESGAGTFAFTVAEPRGIAAAITPFNFPINLVLHKIAPALAAGCAVVLKPSDKAMLVAGLLVEAFEKAGLAAGWLNLVNGSPADIVEPWLADPRVEVLTFTGSTAVGWSLKERSPRKLHVLELGSNTGMVVTDSADVERAANDAVTAGFTNAGQACVSLQRIYLTRGVADSFIERFTELVSAVPFGDPHEDATVVGPLITAQATEKLKAAVDVAVGSGARLLTGGEVVDGILTPTVLADVPATDPLVCEEAFGPIVSVLVVDDLDAAIDGVSSSDYALNTAIYTSDLGEAMAYAKRAEAGSVLVNMPPSFRADHMPYGGVKGSGQGTEGVKYAIDELLHHKLVVLKP